MARMTPAAVGGGVVVGGGESAVVRVCRGWVVARGSHPHGLHGFFRQSRNILLAFLAFRGQRHGTLLLCQRDRCPFAGPTRLARHGSSRAVGRRSKGRGSRYRCQRSSDRKGGVRVPDSGLARPTLKRL